MRSTQFFSDEYLAHCRAMTPEQILGFLEDFRLLHGAEARSRLISLKVPEPLLAAFKAKARLAGIRYQTQIKRLMQEWVDPDLKMISDDLRAAEPHQHQRP